MFQNIKPGLNDWTFKVSRDIADFILGIQIKRNPNTGTKTTYIWLTFGLYVIHDNS
jgi:hypothetical protein